MNTELDTLRQAVAEQPDDWPARRELAASLFAAGQRIEAAQRLIETPVTPPTEEDLQFTIELIGRIDPGQAESFADLVLQSDPANPATHVGRAFAALCHGDTAKASTHYATARAIQPDYASPALEAKLQQAGWHDSPTRATPQPASPPPVRHEPVALDHHLAAVIAAALSSTRSGHLTLPAAPVSADEHAAVASPGTVNALLGNGQQPVATHQAAAAPLDLATANQHPAAAPFLTLPPEALGNRAQATAVATGSLPLEATVVPPAGEPATPLSPEQEAELEEARQEAKLAAAIAHSARSTHSKEKTTAFTVAVLAHIAILVLLALVIVAPALMPAPEIVAVTAPVTSQTELQSRQVAPVVQRTPAAPSRQTTQILNAAGPSDVSISSVEFTPDIDTIDFGSSIGSSFSAGVSGAGIGGAGVPFAMKSRCSRPERVELLQRHGGTVEVEMAVERSLEWLQRNQNSNGSWGSSRPAAMTGFALLCYLGRCETPDSPKYGDTVMNGIMYLVELGMQNDGLFTHDPANRHFPYEHGIATYALGETYAMARMGNRRLPGVREAFQRGVDIILKGQNRDGGWVYGYTREGNGDTSVTGWQYQALRAAQTTGLQFSNLNGHIRRTREYLNDVQGPQGSFGYRGRGDKPSLAGLGALGLQLMGAGHTSSAEKAIEFIKNRPAMTWQTYELYTAYYNTQAVFNAGGEAWQKWNQQMLPMLLERQNDDGSWPREPHDSVVASGRAGADWQIYLTTLNTLNLEIYYRYLPVASSREFNIFDQR